MVRDARMWNGVYLDIFVDPESELAEPHPGMLDMRHGRILCEQGEVAQRFFAKLEEIYQKGPERLPLDEISALRAWHRKGLERIHLGGIQGNLRRAELIPALLEHFFTIRGEWCRGPKASFLWLKNHRPDLFEAFDRALIPGAPIESIEDLVERVDRDLEREACPKDMGDE